MNLPLTVFPLYESDGGRGHGLRREFHQDASADIGFAGNLQFAPDDVRHAPRHRQAEPQPGERPLERAVHLLKRLEDRIDLVFLDADSGIANFDLDAAAVRSQSGPDLDFSLGREFYRVDRKSTRLNSSHSRASRMPSSA